jgi:hypothetical protein
VPSPALDDDSGFFQRVEDLAVEQFVAELRVEALTVTILPGAAWFDIGRLLLNGLPATADDVASVGEFLLSDSARMMTGQIVMVDCGRSILAASPKPASKG